jgi:colanic acid/amylovoran biosynthesis protein
MVRDEFSMQTMKGLNYLGNHFQTKDAAFLLEGSNALNTKKNNKVAVSVREWSFDERDMNHYINLISQICHQLVERGYSIEFLSTCQGVQGYKDDSKTAVLIKKNLDEKFNIHDNVLVDSSYYNVEALMNKLGEYNFVVGTRLHMCILSWISNVPALNISYEAKGKECYNYLGIPRYSIDFNESITEAEKVIDEFISDQDTIKNEVNERVGAIREEVKADFEKFVERLELSDN